MSYILFAWIASFLFGMVAVIGKLTSKYAIHNPWLFNFLWSFFSLLLIIPTSVINHATLPIAWNNIIITGILSSLFSITYIIGLTRLDVTVFSALFNIRPALTVIFSALIIGELLSSGQYLLILIILIAGIFSCMDEKFSLRSFTNNSIAITTVSIVCYALSNIFINRSIVSNTYWTATLWNAVIAQLLLTATIPKFIQDLKRITPGQVLSVFCMSVSLYMGTLAANKAYAENVSVTATITALPFSMIIVFILSLVQPKLLEKHTLKVYAVRFLSAAVMIAAALKLSL